MPKHSETRHLPYTPEQMFDLVADVARYPEFLPWVSAMRVRSDSDEETVADMIVGFKGLRETFTSRVTKTRPEAIDVEYLDGPLKYLRNNWRFRPEEQGCAVDFIIGPLSPATPEKPEGPTGSSCPVFTHKALGLLVTTPGHSFPGGSALIQYHSIIPQTRTLGFRS